MLPSITELCSREGERLPSLERIAFVIGNGPSLTPEWLDHLVDQNVTTFAVNRIHLVYHLTEWRPTYYVRTEPPGGDDPERFFQECRLHIDAGELCVFPHWEDELGQHKNVEYINTCHHYKYGADNAPSAWHLPMVCDFGTVVTAAMQVAVMKGYEAIVLAGCDLTGGHFTEDYGPSLIQTDLWKKAHEIARRSSPVPIINLMEY